MISNMCDMINMGDYTSLKLGQIYSSFEEVKAAISRYEKKNYVNLYVNNSRTISSTIKRMPSKVIKAKTFKSKSKGIRPNQRIVFSLKFSM
jgi:zinc finger SWIM domain-containing protein 3